MNCKGSWNQNLPSMHVHTHTHAQTQLAIFPGDLGSASCSMIFNLYLFIDSTSPWDQLKLLMSSSTQSHQFLLGRCICLVASTTIIIWCLTQHIHCSTCPNSTSLASFSTHGICVTLVYRAAFQHTLNTLCTGNEWTSSKRIKKFIGIRAHMLGVYF